MSRKWLSSHFPVLLQLIMMVRVISRTEAQTVNANLNACLLVERRTKSLFYSFERSAAAVDLAVQYANDVILYGLKITLNTTYTDIGSTCDARNHLVSYAIGLRDTGVVCDVYIGPGCGVAAESLNDYTSSVGAFVIGCPAAGLGISAPRAQYPYMARISITHHNNANIIMQFLSQHNYNTATIIGDTSNSFYQQLNAFLENQMRSSDEKFIRVSSSRVTAQDIRTLLEANSARSRVFVLCIPSVTVRIFMLAAYDLGYTSGEYVYLGVNLFRSDAWGNFSYSTGDDRDNDARKAYQSLLLISLSVLQDSFYQNFVQQVKKISAEKYGFVYAPTDEVNVITAHFYDSIIYYAFMIRDLARSPASSFSGTALSLLKQRYNFTSPINGLVTMTVDGDRRSAYTVKNFNNDSGQFEDYLNYPVVGSSHRLGVLRWPSGDRLPPNKPRCGYLGKDQSCAYVTPTSQLAAAVAIPVILLTAAVTAGIFLFRRFANSTSDPFWWRIFLHEVQITSVAAKSTAASTLGSVAAKSRVTMDADSTVDTVVIDTSNPIKRAVYDGNTVGLTPLREPYYRVNNGIGKSLLPIRRLQHNNLQKVYGIAVDDENLCVFIVGELCKTLTSVLDKVGMDLDWNFKCALIKDCAAGMTYLHASSLISHGNLSSHVCLVDNNFVLKISDYGMDYFRREKDLRPLLNGEEEQDVSLLFWRAPELLRTVMPPGGTQKGDVYAFSIILQQIVLRTPPFRLNEGRPNTLTDKEILLEVKRGSTPPLRPRIPLTACPTNFRDLMEQCWDENPELRLTFPRIKDMLSKILGKAGENIVDHLIRSMEKRAFELEHEAEEQTRQFMEEKTRSENILGQMLPKMIALSLTKGETILPETFSSTTVYFSDINGFPELIAAASTPLQTIFVMNTLYDTCDNVIEKYDVFKVETVKDAYLLVSGLPNRNGINHASEISNLALILRREISVLQFNFAENLRLKLRVGIHSGPCVAAVIGLKMPRYCLFGDTVNTSSRMESHGEAGKIQCSPSTKDLLAKIGGFVLLPRGPIEIKGKGMMETFWLLGKEDE